MGLESLFVLLKKNKNKKKQKQKNRQYSSWFERRLFCSQKDVVSQKHLRYSADGNRGECPPPHLEFSFLSLISDNILISEVIWPSLEVQRILSWHEKVA